MSVGIRIHMSRFKVANIFAPEDSRWPSRNTWQWNARFSAQIQSEFNKLSPNCRTPRAPFRLHCSPLPIAARPCLAHDASPDRPFVAWRGRLRAHPLYLHPYATLRLRVTAKWLLSPSRPAPHLAQPTSSRQRSARVSRSAEDGGQRAWNFGRWGERSWVSKDQDIAERSLSRRHLDSNRSPRDQRVLLLGFNAVGST